MKIEQQATILSADSKPYDFNGRQGVSHKVRANILGEIYSLRASQELVSSFQKQIGKEGLITLKFSSPKENLRVEVLSFEPDEE